ncbi:penicillin-binding protein 2 [Candidatus Parcubacteria bacterium]|nr:penicillin-binding protein 2 [Candidatus Parcubacteria bacterium]
MFKFLPLKRYKNRKVKVKFKEEIEPQEILLDNLSKRRHDETGLSEKKLEIPLSKRILQGIYFIFLILILILFGKTFQLQVVQGEDFSKLSEANRFIVHRLQSQRGVIYDKDFNQLVFNKPSFDLVCYKENLPGEETEKKRILREISAVIEKDISLLEEEIDKSDTSQILISENLDYQKLIILEARKKEFPGFEIIDNIVREYKKGPLFSHLIGYERKTGEKTGLENFYDEYLKEKPGEFHLERDAQGNLISEEILSLPEPGNSLVLWLDSQLQEKVQKELLKGIAEVGSKKGAVVVLDAKTGGVLSLVSMPTFDNNLFSQGMSIEEWKEIDDNPYSPLLNRVVSAGYLTGSTIKPLIASAVLEEEIIRPDKKIICQGKITIPNPWDPSSPTIKKDWTTHHWTDMRKAIAESCNVYFYTVGGGYENQEGLGPTRIKKYLDFFGWGEKTGVDIGGEITGFIPDKEWKKEKWGQGWWDGDTYNLSIGQGFLEITPLEVVNSFAAIANGGTLFQPQLVKEIVDKEKEIVKVFEPKVIRQNFISSANLQIVREGMRQAVTGKNSPHASAVELNSLPVAVAAKTGTAELGNDYYHNWVTVFAPYDDPEIVLTLVIENVEGDRIAALPVAKAILEWYFRNEK